MIRKQKHYPSDIGRNRKLLDECNENLPMLITRQTRPLRLSGSCPISVRKLAWRIKRLPRIAARHQAFLIYPGGTHNTRSGWVNRYSRKEPTR